MYCRVVRRRVKLYIKSINASLLAITIDVRTIGRALTSFGGRREMR